MPTTPVKAYRHVPGLDRRSRVTRGWNMQANTSPFDVTGHPALSVPCGMSHGLPVGLMLVGRHFDEATVLRVGQAAEASSRPVERHAGGARSAGIADGVHTRAPPPGLATVWPTAIAGPAVRRNPTPKRSRTATPGRVP